MEALLPLKKYIGKQRASGERCELCAGPLLEEHGHVVDVQHRKLCCACTPCALLFSSPEAGSRFRGVPQRVLRDSAWILSREGWEAQGVPVQLAFLFRNSSLDRWVAVYPSPAGPTEVVQAEDWPDPTLSTAPLFQALEADVEALLVYGPRGATELETFLTPIDRCYELLSIVRKEWRGFDGGEAREVIDSFFQTLRQEAQELGRQR